MAQSQFEQLTGTGLFIGTTDVWDTAQIYQANIKDPELELLLVKLYQNLGIMATAVNWKDSGYYFTREFVNGQIFFPNPVNNSSTQTAPAERQVYRQTINFGALPNNATKTVAHNIPITATTTFTRIYGAASDTSGNNYIPLPYVDAAGSNVQLSVNGANVTVTTTSNRTNFTICYVIVEYIQS